MCAGIFLFAGCDENKEEEPTQSTYSIVLLDEDRATTLYAEKFEEGAKITNIPTPTKAEDATATYTFAGWVDEMGRPVVLAFANKDITAYARYTATPKEYSFSILVNDEQVLTFNQVEVFNETSLSYITSNATVHYGDRLFITIKGTDGYAVVGNTQYKGLSKVVEMGASYFVVTGDVTISIKEEQETYTVDFYDDNDNLLDSESTTYGKGVKFGGETPTKETDLRASYTFDYWVDENGKMVSLNNITDNISLYPHYKETLVSYALTIENTSKVSVFKNGEQMYNGGVIYYNDTLEVVFNVSEGHHIASATATAYLNGEEQNTVDISGGEMTVLGDMTISFSEAINTYSVSVYDEDKTTVLYSNAAVDWGTGVTFDTPTKAADETYTYEFARFVDANGNAVDLSSIKSNVVAYATYTSTYIEYTISLSDNVTLTVASTEYTNEDELPTLHYGDTFKVSYDLADGFTLNTFTVDGAVKDNDNYSLTGNVTATFLMEKTFKAFKYDNMQKFTKFTGTSEVLPASCTDNGTYYTYKYVGSKTVSYEAVYEEFLNVGQVQNLLKSGEKYDHKFDTTTNTLSLGNQNYATSYITTPLYKGMVLQFEITVTSAPTFGFGISEYEFIDNAANYVWNSNLDYYCAQYDYFVESGKGLSGLVSAYEAGAGSDDKTNRKVSIGSVNMSTAGTYTIALVLDDSLQLYVDGNVVSVNLNGFSTYNVATNYNLKDNTPYYFTFFSSSPTVFTAVQFTEFEYTEISSFAYLQYLSGKEISLLGDSITYGLKVETSERYATLLANMLGMEESNYGISGTTYCTNTGRQSRIDDASKLSTDSEIVIVYLGINDFDVGVGLGDEDETSTDLLYGAIKALYQNLATRFAGTNATIYICTPAPSKTDITSPVTNSAGCTLQDYADAIEAVASEYGFQIIDLYNMGLTTEDYVDNLHPNATGHQLLAKYIENSIVEYGRYTDYAA